MRIIMHQRKFVKNSILETDSEIGYIKYYASEKDVQ